MALRNSETGSNTFSISENEPQKYSETNESSESSLLLTKRRNVSGKKQGWCSIYVNDDQDQLQQLALHLFSVVSSQAIYMAKIRSYYLSNSDKELQLYGKDLNYKELYESINTSIVTYDLLETSDENTNNGVTNNLDNTNESKDLERLTLNIADSVDLVLLEFLVSGDAIFFSDSVTTNWARDVGNINYNPIELACQMVQDEED
ncbi:21640_t:CDS:2 [Cetraspora pellucida]|uniref:21640_t:CDS:1 n=1 Tax=Cetraspora pellucida TaxID=1433469 RepID=A0A9N9NTA1_9GLOM|nr:21640_t:CDS:2 [Cetraspora pellucida]